MKPLRKRHGSAEHAAAHHNTGQQHGILNSQHSAAVMTKQGKGTVLPALVVDKNKSAIKRLKS